MTSSENIPNPSTRYTIHNEDVNQKIESSPAAFELKRVVPDVVSTDINQRFQKGIEKQRKLLANLIFPSHIPGPCHPNVSSFAELIRATSTSHVDDNSTLMSTTPDEVSSEERQTSNRTSLKFTQQDLDLLQSVPRARATMTPLEEIGQVQEKCDVYFRRAKHFERLARQQKENGAENNALVETVSMSKIFQMNYRYCIASVSCPKRIAVLNNCYSQYPPDVVQALVKAGQHEFLCQKERKAVERCCGQKVQNIIRILQQQSES